jgi:hypothetical protein
MDACKYHLFSNANPCKPYGQLLAFPTLDNPSTEGKPSSGAGWWLKHSYYPTQVILDRFPFIPNKYIYIYMYVDLVWHMKHQVNYDNYERVILARNLMVIAILTHWAHGIVILSMPVGRYCIQITARDQGLHAGAHFGDLGALGGSSHSGTDS